MIVRHLGNTNFNVIMECFLLAFKNYFVQMPTDHTYYKDRWKAAKVRFDLSYGMFDDDRLVGFIINAIDTRDGVNTAFNTGTGVVPKYRGKRIVKSIYDFAIPDLKQKGITKCLLEVIAENDKAIRAYQGIGFKIYKHYRCFSGEISTMNKENFKLKEVNFKNVDWKTLPNQELYSWDNHNRCLEKENYKYFQVLDEEDTQAFFIININNGYVAQLDVLKETTANWNALFSAIKLITNIIKINNVDTRLIEKINAIESVGLQNSVNQFEMELDLKTK